ncbi:MAG: hypothetical protein JO354_13145 [Verrucomicrobia bacterium]|nr:hypothetical protein [Verrucomicrobiota bacterium]
MKKLIALLLLAPALLLRADDILPKRPDFAAYKAMLDRSPFAVATAQTAQAAAPDFARDWYVANAARLETGDLVTIASTTDKNFKEYLTTKEPNEHGIAISEIKWSDRLGETKVTITKDGKYATLGFNQALLSQPAQNPALPMLNPAIVQQPAVIPPQPFLKAPAPIPSLPPAVQVQQQTPDPQNRFRTRGVIQRPLANAPAPTPAEEPTASEEE